MNNFLKNIIAISVSVLVILSIYYGAYLPFRKSQLYVNSMMNLRSGSVKSVADLQNVFNPALNYYSPVGQDEEMASYIEVLSNVALQQNNKPVVDAVVKMANDAATPELNNPEKGFNYGQTVYALGLIYSMEGLKFHDQAYLQRSIDLFNEGLKFDPKRAAYLYGLFDTYSQEGDKEMAKRVGQTILSYWPTDQQVKDYLTNN